MTILAGAAAAAGFAAVVAFSDWASPGDVAPSILPIWTASGVAFEHPIVSIKVMEQRIANTLGFVAVNFTLPPHLPGHRSQAEIFWVHP